SRERIAAGRGVIAENTGRGDGQRLSLGCCIAVAIGNGRTGRTRAENHIHPIIGGIKALRGETARGTIVKDPVAASLGIAQGMQRTVGYTAIRKETAIKCVFSLRSKIGNNISCVRLDGDRGREVHLLPSGGSFVRKCCTGQKSPGARPEIADVDSGIERSFVETHSSNRTAYI